MTQTPSPPASVVIDPPLEPSEVDFLAGFSTRGDIRRVWPGQPSQHCPWRVAADGRTLDLDLDLAQQAAGDVAPWLRFLCQEFLAPSTIEAMHTALEHRLRGGHQITGTVVVDVHVVTVDRNRIVEHVLAPESEAVVLPFDLSRKSEERAGSSPGGAGQKRCVER